MKIGSLAANGSRKRQPDRISAREVFYRKDRTDPASIYEAVATRFEPKLADAIMSAFTEQAAALDLDALADAIEAGDVSKVLSMLDLDPSLAAMRTVTPVVQETTYAGGVAATATISAWKPTRLTVLFDTLNPRLTQWLQTYNLALIRQINEGTREGVRQYLVAGMQAGRNPKAVAREIKEIVGLTDRQARAVYNFRRELEEFHLRRTGGGYGIGRRIDRVNGTQVLRPGADGKPKDGINERRLRDFRFDRQLGRAVSSGKPLSQQQIDKMVAGYARKYRAYRSRTIARTEAIRATNVGVQEAWHQAIQSGVVPEGLTRKKWIVATDERTCEVCGPIPSMNPAIGVKHGRPFQTPQGPVDLPPVHPNCRCTIFYRVYEPSQVSGDG